MTIFIDNLKLYAHHGVLPQERSVGAEFLVSLRADCDVAPSAYDQDLLDGTVSYADLCQDIQAEMDIPSNLLEHVATRIARRIIDRHQRAHSVWVRVVKCNPPIGCQLDAAGVELTLKR